MAQGFSQVPGVHYQETYSPTPNLCVFRMLLTYAVQHDLDLKQMDVHTAFLIPELPAEEVIYMRVPPGLHPFLKKCGIDMKVGQSLKLNKCIYGLKQASKYWNKKLVAVLSKLGFKQVPEEPCLFVKSTPGSAPVFILIWVDDLLMAGTTKALNVVTKLLKKALPMKDLGYPSLFTGVAIEKHAKGLFLSQKIFAEKALAMFKMSDCKPLHSPTTGTRLTKEGAPALDPKVPYRSAVGVLLWLARNTRPDLSFAVSQVARFCHAPTTAHWSAVKRIFRDLKGTIDLGIPIYKQSTKLFTLKALTDADWAGDAENRYTTGGYIIMIGGIPIFWVSTVYKAVCKSSVESEVVYLSKCSTELVWVIRVFLTFCPGMKLPVTVFCDNQGAQAVSKNNAVTTKLKHIQIQNLFVRECVSRGLVTVEYLETEDMLTSSPSP